jgi:hypothetical protein
MLGRILTLLALALLAMILLMWMNILLQGGVTPW